jgi:alanine racemase
MAESLWQRSLQRLTIPLIYADQVLEAENGVGFVTIKDKKTKILGIICMDMLMVDVAECNCTEEIR